MGGSEALLWLADKVMVCTVRDGSSSGATVNWSACIKREEFPTIDTSWRKVSAAYVPAELIAPGSGTYIRIHLHRGHRLPNDGAQRSALRSPISRLFAPGLRAGRRIVWNGEKLQPYSPGLGPRRPELPGHGQVGRRTGTRRAGHLRAVRRVARECQAGGHVQLPRCGGDPRWSR